MRWLIAALVVLGCLGLASGDVIRLKNGHKVRGRVIESESNDRWLVVELPTGRAKFPRKLIRSIEKEDPIDYLLRQGLQLSAEGSHEEALVCLNEAAALDPEGRRVKEALARGLVRRGNALRAAGRGLLAARDYEEALGVLPGMPEALRGVEQVKGDVERLEVAAREAEKLGLDGRIAQAIAYFERLIKDDSSVLERVRVRLAKLYVAQGVEQLRGALTKGGVVQHGKAEGAAADFDRALELDNRLMDLIAQFWSGAKVLLGYEGLKVKASTYRTISTVAGGQPVGLVAEALLAESLSQGAAAQKLWARIVGEKAPKELKEQRRRGLLIAYGLVLRGGLSTRPSWDRGAKTETQSTLKTEAFVLRHQNLKLAKLVLASLKRSLRLLGREFGVKVASFVGGQIAVTVHATKRSYQEAGARSGALAFTRLKQRRFGRSKAGRIEASIHFQQSDRQLLTATIPHELAHALSSLALKWIGGPRWYREGIATSFEPETKARYYRALVARARQSRRTIPLSRLLSQEGYPGKDQIHVFYAESHGLVAELIRRKGIKTVLKLGQMLKTEPTASVALRKIYGINNLVKLEAKLGIREP